MSTPRTRAALALGTVVVVTTGMAAAYASSQAGDGTISACVSVKTGAMRLEKPKMPCITEGPRKIRERRVTWNEQGLPGVDGADGANGADGATGPAGPAGPQGPQGPQGLQGTTGNDGDDGDDGQDGAPGSDGASFLSGTGTPAPTLGQDGDTYLNLNNGRVFLKGAGVWNHTGNLSGPQGSAGNDGAAGADGSSFRSGTADPADSLGDDGDTYLNLTDGSVFTKSGGTWSPAGSLKGPAGGGTIFTASSGTPAIMTTIAGGLVGTGTMFPLSGSAATTGVTVSGNSVDTTLLGGQAQVLPHDTVVTDIAASFSNTVALSLVGTTLNLTAQLYTGDAASNTLTAVPGATCTLAPSMTGIQFLGATSTCRQSGLNIPVPAGQKAVVMLTATATGLTLVNTVTGFASTSVATAG